VTAPATGQAVPDPRAIKAQAYGLGFDLVGIATLGPAGTWPAYARWLERGFAGDMAWLHRDAALRKDMRLPKRGAKTAIVVGLDYGGRAPAGTVARYARGRDYHEVIKSRLHRLLAWLEESAGHRVSGRPYVDSGPILERDLARLAGLGWFGKNSMLIHPQRGSFFFLAALFTELELSPDEPFGTEHCGTCRRCIDACPTGAIVEDGVVDATRCLSYLTIEKRGAIPPEWRESMNALLFGCDICQDVCPWNQRFAGDAHDPELMQGVLEPSPDPIAVLSMDEPAFHKRFGGTAVLRATRSGMVRNAAVALGNRGAPGDVDALRDVRGREPDPVVAEHIDWALARLGGTTS